MTYPRFIGHRGGGALAPENTLAGFHVAKRLGFRGVEFDAMLTADGVPVLIHDETLERTTSGSGPVAAVTAAQFATLDAGSKHHKAFRTTPPPTLRQALQVCAELGLWANVEIKPATGHDRATGIAVAMECAQARCDLVLSSFSMESLRAATGVASNIPRALLFETIPADWRSQLNDFDAIALHVSATEMDENNEALAAVCRSGQLVACYTVNDRQAAERLFAAGVSSVFTDRLDLWATSEL